MYVILSGPIQLFCIQHIHHPDGNRMFDLSSTVEYQQNIGCAAVPELPPLPWRAINVIRASRVQEVTKGPMSKTDTRYDPATDELGYNVGSEESKTYLDERPEMAGTKSTLAPSVKKLSQRELHERHGHIGVHPGCSLCKSVMRTTRKAQPENEAFKERRPGVFWAMDIFTPNVVGYDGSRYINVIGDVGSGYMDVSRRGGASFFL